MTRAATYEPSSRQQRVWPLFVIETFSNAPLYPNISGRLTSFTRGPRMWEPIIAREMVLNSLAGTKKGKYIYNIYKWLLQENNNEYSVFVRRLLNRLRKKDHKMERFFPPHRTIRIHENSASRISVRVVERKKRWINDEIPRSDTET